MSKLLLIDDDRDVHYAFQRSFDSPEIEVTTAPSGEEGLRIIPKLKPDLVILDVMMPDLNGVQICRMLRADPKLKSVPVIFLTAKAMVSELERLRALGAAGVLTKPFDPMLLAASIRAILGVR